MKKTKKIIGGLTALAVISAMCAPMSVSAETATTDVTMTKVSPYDELYTVTIPETVTVTNSGWNELKAGDVSGIKVEQTVTAPDKQFDPAKKVSISVASANSYKLKDGDNTVSYTLNAEANGEAVDKWEFLAEEVNAGTAKTVGVDVDADEYDAAPDGSYTDTLTFTVSLEDAAVAVTGVTLNKTSLELTAGGDTETLTATVAPDTATDKTVTWTSSDESVATVDSTGKVTGVGAGTATITATAGSKSATCTVTVKKTLTLTGWYFSYEMGDLVEFSLNIQYTDSDTWKDIAERYDEVSLVNNAYGPEEGKIVKLYEGTDTFGAELKSNESSYNYRLVSINDKVSAYSSYYTE